MADSTYTPVIIGAILTPNPAQVGSAVTISVAAVDIVSTPDPEVFYAGEICAGEV